MLQSLNLCFVLILINQFKFVFKRIVQITSFWHQVPKYCKQRMWEAICVYSIFIKFDDRIWRSIVSENCVPTLLFCFVQRTADIVRSNKTSIIFFNRVNFTFQRIGISFCNFILSLNEFQNSKFDLNSNRTLPYKWVHQESTNHTIPHNVLYGLEPYTKSLPYPTPLTQMCFFVIILMYKNALFCND